MLCQVCEGGWSEWHRRHPGQAHAVFLSGTFQEVSSHHQWSLPAGGAGTAAGFGLYWERGEP